MITEAIILSFQIAAIYAITKPGMILGTLTIWLANRLDYTVGLKWSKIIQKPLWDCYTCMSGVWTIVLTMQVDIWMILLVCGLNFLIGSVIIANNERDIAE